MLLGAMLAMGTLVGCGGRDSLPRGQTASGSRTTTASSTSSSNEGYTEPWRTLVRGRHGTSLSTSDRRILRTAPADLKPYIHRATRVNAPGLRGRYWLGPGVLDARRDRKPGICLYWKPPGVRSVGAGCFDVATFRRGRAVAVLAYSSKTSVDVIGVVPADATRAVIESQGGVSHTATVIRGIYAIRLGRSPIRVFVHRPLGIERIEL